jgi:uncharacterized protein (TIGR00369 family)
LLDSQPEPIRGFNKLLGFHIVEWRADYVRVEMPIEEHHLNRSGTVHGGIYATLIDASGSFAGIYPVREGAGVRRCVTLTTTTSFLGQAKKGRLVCVSERKGGGKTIFIASSEVRDDKGNILAIGEGTYRYIAETPR